MPTAKPRITITLTEQQHQVLSSLSRHQKISMSAIVVDFLESTMPVLERLSEVLEHAANAPQSVRDQIRQSAEDAEKEYGHLPAKIQDQLALMSSFVSLEPAEAGDTNPPPLTGGSDFHPPLADDRQSPLKKRTSRSAK